MEQVATDSALKAILDRVAVPVWVLDHRGMVLLANPAALELLGFDELLELQGRHGHDAVHFMHPDGSPFPAEGCPVLAPSRTGVPVHRDEDWFIRRDGTMIPVAFTSVPIDLPTGRGILTTFIDSSAQREAEQAARRRTIEAADAARAQLARDLHDGAQQQFVTALLNFQLAAKKASSDPDAATAFQETGVALTKAGVEELRGLAAGIHPGILTDRGLGPAVEALANRAPLPVSVVQTLDRRLPTAVEASIYFFISEALTNITKHARAEEAWVRIGTEDGRLIVVVADDGIGGASATPAGIGLAGLADRVAALDGELTITSPAAEGTTLHAAIPLS